MAMLPDDPRPLGRPIDDRAAWDPVARSPAGIKAIADAAALLEKPMDEFDRDLYMAFYENGNRTRSQRHNGRRWGRLCVLTLGELLENRGRFIPAIQQSVASLCRDPSWVLSAHDRNAGVITGRTVYVDLAAAMNGYNTALADSLLGDRLDEPTRRLIRENLQRRVVDPIFDAIRSPDGTRGGLWWRNTTNNWNAVCTAGTTGVILATVQSKRDRAEAVAAALDNTTRFLSGFTGDGYCSEGVHYWSFGMGHFAVLRQLLLEQTGGRIDLLDDPRAKIAAQFPLKIHLLDGVWPAFADAEMRARPADEVMTYLG
jgi:hypothetical protein